METNAAKGEEFDPAGEGVPVRSESLSVSPKPEGVARALSLVRLDPLMELTRGRPEIVVAIIDGPIASGLTSMPAMRVRPVPGAPPSVCAVRERFACAHGTLVAGIVAAEPSSPTPAICPGCTFLAWPVFPEHDEGSGGMPSTSPEELADALVACGNAGAQVINLSLGILQPSARAERSLRLALDTLVQRGVLLVVAAGNQGRVGGSPITSHPWALPVTACDQSGAPIGYSNFGASIGRRGIAAPGEGVTSLDLTGQPALGGGTSVATPFVTGAIALLWSEHPGASAGAIKQAILQPHVGRRPRVVPPLLDAWGAYAALQRTPYERNQRS